MKGMGRLFIMLAEVSNIVYTFLPSKSIEAQGKQSSGIFIMSRVTASLL